jgi:hypothetical protein
MTYVPTVITHAPTITLVLTVATMTLVPIVATICYNNDPKACRLLGNTWQTDMDRLIRCSSLIPECKKHLKIFYTEQSKNIGQKTSFK